MIKKVSSTGYLRKRLPRELTSTSSTKADLLTNNQNTMFDSQDNEEIFNKATNTFSEGQPNTGESKQQDKVNQRKIAKLQGYEGDPCNECGSFTLVRSGTCLKCNNCGSTTGCS